LKADDQVIADLMIGAGKLASVSRFEQRGAKKN